MFFLQWVAGPAGSWMCGVGMGVWCRAGAVSLPPLGRSGSKTPSGRLVGSVGKAWLAKLTEVLFPAGPAPAAPCVCLLALGLAEVGSGGRSAFSDPAERTPQGGPVDQGPLPGHVSAPTTPRRRMFGKRTRVRPIGGGYLSGLLTFSASPLMYRCWPPYVTPYPAVPCCCRHGRRRHRGRWRGPATSQFRGVLHSLKH
jgi:hypothetical protein